MVSYVDCSILIAGVGGQGIIRAGDILCLVALASGFDVKKSEVHGMAQRGGCVTSHIRYGDKIYSPIAKKGDIDILISFEKLETLRYLDYLKPGGKIIVNSEELYPPSVNTGEALYPDDVIEVVKQNFKEVKVVDATEIAIKAGNIRAVNTVLLGVLSSFLNLSYNTWDTVIGEVFSDKFVKVNLTAFHLGRVL